jgi:hypothetical protein
MTMHSRPRIFAYASFVVALIGCRGPEGPTGPAGPPGQNGGASVFVTQMGTASLIVNDSVFRYAPVPGLSADVAVPAGATFKLLIETDGGIQVNSPDPLASCFVDVAVFVDGAQVGSGRRVSAANGPVVVYGVSSYGFSAQATVSSGTHTVAVMAKEFATTFTECYVSSGASGSSLPGNPRLQGMLNIVAFP